MNGDVRITYDDLKKAVEEEIGVESWIELGPTGRRFQAKFFGREEVVDEQADFELGEVADACGILTDDDLREAAMDGILKYLKDNAADFKARLLAKAEEMKAAQLATPLEGLVAN